MLTMHLKYFTRAHHVFDEIVTLSLVVTARLASIVTSREGVAAVVDTYKLDFPRNLPSFTSFRSIEQYKP